MNKNFAPIRAPYIPKKGEKTKPAKLGIPKTNPYYFKDKQILLEYV